jgi:hypothetical protein
MEKEAGESLGERSNADVEWSWYSPTLRDGDILLTGLRPICSYVLHTCSRFCPDRGLW